jgi:hypothetical protein
MSDDRVIPTVFMSGSLAVAIENTEVHQVNVDWVNLLDRRGWKPDVLEGPDLEIAPLRLHDGPFRVERLTVDGPREGRRRLTAGGAGAACA